MGAVEHSMTTTPQEPDPEAADQPILSDRDEADAIKSATPETSGDSAEQG